MTTDLTVKQDSAIIEQVILHGNLAELTPGDRVIYYGRLCESMGLNPLTRPFEYIMLNNKLTLYARKDATDQLRSIKGVSIQITGREVTEGVYVVSAKATAGGRTDESTGAVNIDNLKGEARANAMMKAETKAKRRVTLSIVGLGWLDESEVSDIPQADVKVVTVDKNTGEIADTLLEQTEPAAVEMVTDAQRRKIFASAKQHGYTEDNVRDYIFKKFVKAHTADLTKVEASSVIEAIEKCELCS